MTYLGAAPTTTASRKSQVTYRYLMTAGQSVISGSDLNNNTLSCDPLDTEVFMNGLKLDSTDTTITATQVSLAVPAAAGDEIEVVAYRTFESADHYDKSTSDTRYVNASGDTMTGDLTISSTAGQLKLTDTDGTEQNTTIKQSGGNVFIQARDNTNNAGIVFAGNGGGNYDEHMRINASGYVTKPSQPVFGARGYSAAGTTIGSNMAPMRWQSVHTNVGNHFNNTTGLFTFPVSGRYYFDCNINLKATANQWLGIYMMYNNTQHVNSWANTSDSTYQNTIVSGVVDATANDTMSFCYHNTYSAPSSSSNDIKYNHANIYLIG